MKIFCKHVLEFLKSEYSDAYNFKIEYTATLCGEDTAELQIEVGPKYKIKVSSQYMKYLFDLFCTGDYIQEREQWHWQKELIDIIEGS